MKRTFFLAVLLGALTSVSTSSGAQDPAVAAAEKEDAEERYKSMNSHIDGLEASLGVVRKDLARLAEELSRLREEVTRLSSKNNDTATKESLGNLAKSIEEVDRKRQSDNDKVLAALTALQKGLEKPVAPPDRGRPLTPTNPSNNPRGGNSNGGRTPAPPTSNGSVEMKGYIIKKGDTLSGIVAKLRSAGIKITQRQIEDANPGVKWNALKVDQQILIPLPAP